eukprot:TRINITY_DN69119_c0_g1_i1.p1 TRINITY_DN69119_c0_g1~~TRINITY_DN69119_c0_g1_i1.p1  ORF type:complete len:181 (-),score=33.47 TRINITY_DN69119_c0_g1_i1:40-582(-)
MGNLSAPANPGDVSGITIVPCEFDGQKFEFEYVGCNTCKRLMTKAHFFNCKTCTDGKIHCVESFDICGPCIGRHTQGHQILEYKDDTCSGMVAPECITGPEVTPQTEKTPSKEVEYWRSHFDGGARQGTDAGAEAASSAEGGSKLRSYVIVLGFVLHVIAAIVSIMRSLPGEADVEGGDL